MILRERITNVLRLECVHRLAHARRTTRHCSDEPFAFVVAAEEAVELGFDAERADGQKQMTLLWLGLHHGNVQRIAQMRRHAELKELARTVALDVHGEIRRADPRAIALSPARGDFTQFQACTHRGELGLDVFSIHMF